MSKKLGMQARLYYSSTPLSDAQGPADLTSKYKMLH